MTLTNLYTPSGPAPRGRPSAATRKHTTLVLPFSARLADSDLSSTPPVRSQRGRAPEARGPEIHPKPAETKSPTPQSAEARDEAQAETAVPGQDVVASSANRHLPVRWSPSPCRLILVARARGGSGATSFAVNLALDMCNKRVSRTSRTRKRVAIVDLDVQFGTVATSLDLVDRGGMVKLAQLPRHPDAQAVRGALLTHESGLRVLAAPANPIPLEALDGPRVAAIIDALMAENDVVIVDMPPALVSWIEPLLSRAERMLMVTNLAVTSIASARRMLDIIREDAPDLKVETVVSRERKPIIRSKLHRQAAEALGAPLSYWLPDETLNTRVALDRGEPMLAFAPRSAWSRAVRRIVTMLDRIAPNHQLQR